MKIYCYLILAIALLPGVLGFALEVHCPAEAVLNAPIQCTITLPEDTLPDDIFGEQFTVSAPGFVAGNPFFNPSTNGVSAFENGTINSVVVLLAFSSGQSAGAVAVFNLVADSTGNYAVDLTNVEVAENVFSDQVVITAPSSSDASGSASAPAGGGVSSSGGGGGGSAATALPALPTLKEIPLQGTGTDVLNPGSKTSNLNDVASKDILNPEVTQSSNAAISKESAKNTWLIAGIIVLVLISASVLVLYIKLNKGKSL